MGHRMTSVLGRPFGRRALLAGGAAAMALPFFARASRADAKPFRISTPGSPEEWQSKALEVFKKEIDAALPGQFDVQIHYNGTLFAQGTEIEAMQRGNLEVGMVSPQDIATLIPEYSIFTTGYLMRDPAHLDAVYDGPIGKDYDARVEKDVGIHLVRSQYLGTRHVILRKALGANPTPMAFEEVYLAMQTGTVDGLENPLPDAEAAKFYEVSKQVVLTGHMVSNTFFAVAKTYWDGLSADQKAAIEAAEAKAKAFNDEGVVKTEADAKSFFEGKGVKVTTPDVEAFRSHVLKEFSDSKFAANWPKGLLEQINQAGR